MIILTDFLHIVATNVNVYNQEPTPLSDKLNTRIIFFLRTKAMLIIIVGSKKVFY